MCLKLEDEIELVLLYLHLEVYWELVLEFDFALKLSRNNIKILSMNKGLNKQA